MSARAGRRGSAFRRCRAATPPDLPCRKRWLHLERFRARELHPALRAAGVEPRRIYDLRHTYATWSLAAGVSLFALSRRMGTSLAMIDATYGHLAPDSETQERALLDAFDTRRSTGTESFRSTLGPETRPR